MSVTPTAPATQPYPEYRGMQFEEDYALVQMLSGLSVPGAKKGQSFPVNVTWRLPERELQQVAYPYFLIDFLYLEPRTQDEHRGIVNFYTEPYTGNYLPGNGSALGEFPLPLWLHYQVSTFASNIQHDIILTDWCTTTFFPIRFGQLNTATGTARRLDFEGMSANSYFDSNNKRIFRKDWSIKVSAEVVPAQTIGTPVEELVIKVLQGPTPSSPTDTEIVERRPA